MIEIIKNFYSITSFDKDIIDWLFSKLPQGNLYIDGCPVGRYLYLIALMVTIWQSIPIIFKVKGIEKL